MVGTGRFTLQCRKGGDYKSNGVSYGIGNKLHLHG